MDDKQVLIVDDDCDLVELIRFYLSKNGYRVLSAHDGLQALKAARENRPGLLLLDLMLPGLDGWDVCRLLRAESDVPIIIVTGCARDEDKVAGLNLGADDYVTKPFRLRELLARIQTVLRHSTQVRPSVARQYAWAGR